MESILSTEALERTPVLNLANTCCSAGSFRKARSLRTSSFFPASSSYIFTMALAFDLLEP